MARASEDERDAILGIGLPFSGVRRGPVGFGLFFDGGNHHRNCLIEFTQDFRLRQLLRLRKFQITIAYVTGFGDLRADVITQIAGQVQHQMPDAVAVRERIVPELLLGKRVNPLVEFRRAVAIFTDKGGTDAIGKLTQSVFFGD